jgi:2'-hydroxyisoflavone reductase
MKLLVLGGTLFLGRHIVEAALDRRHDVTLFNRGHTHPDLFPNTEKLHGDRTGDLRALYGRTWDAVIDTCGYVPRLVQTSATVLKDAVDHYSFISSVSVYADLSEPGLTETATVRTLADPTSEEVGPQTYGPLKALCKQAVDALLPGRTLIIRPGLLVGPHDPTGRFTYWVQRVAAGGEVLAPGAPERQVQCIDARDAASWIVQMTEEQRTGVFHMTGPHERLSMGMLLEVCRQALNREARFTWVAEAFLAQHGVRPWTDLPLWVPPHAKGLLAIDISKARQAGLAFRPLTDTILDTFQWAAQQAPEASVVTRLASGESTQAGLEQARETILLQDWHTHQ